MSDNTGLVNDNAGLAHWVFYPNSGTDYIHCSNCGCFWDWGTICEVGMYYCPNCGTKIEEGVVELR